MNICVLHLVWYLVLIPWPPLVDANRHFYCSCFLSVSWTNVSCLYRERKFPVSIMNKLFKTKIWSHYKFSVSCLLMLSQEMIKPSGKNLHVYRIYINYIKMYFCCINTFLAIKRKLFWPLCLFNVELAILQKKCDNIIKQKALINITMLFNCLVKIFIK